MRETFLHCFQVMRGVGEERGSYTFSFKLVKMVQARNHLYWASLVAYWTYDNPLYPCTVHRT